MFVCLAVDYPLGIVPEGSDVFCFRVFLSGLLIRVIVQSLKRIKKKNLANLEQSVKICIRVNFLY